jgi:Ca-activated chloride channel family protein
MTRTEALVLVAMFGLTRFALLVGCFWGMLALAASACELGLILASDVSSSMTAPRSAMVRKGTADALRQRDLADALAGQDAWVMLVDWADGVRMVSDWRPIAGADDLADLAMALESTPPVTVGAGTTMIGGLLRFARAAFDAKPCDRMVLDVMSDGNPSEGARSEQVFDDRHTVNVILVQGGGDAAKLMHERIRWGWAGFLMPVASFAEFPAAMRAKLLLEVS